jgi:hypothetical protein
MNCINCHRAMYLSVAQYSCPFCGVQAFANANESALAGVPWLDQAPYFIPVGPIGATAFFSSPKAVMLWPTTSSTPTIVNPDLRP